MDPHDTSNDVDDKNSEFVKINIERVVIGRGFLPRINYGENNIACNLKCLINAIKHILNDDKIKISIYKSRYDDELIDI